MVAAPEGVEPEPLDGLREVLPEPPVDAFLAFDHDRELCHWPVSVTMTGMGVRPLRLGHVGIAVRDMDRMVEFYRTVLGMDVSDRMTYPGDAASVEGTWLRCNSDHHVLALVSVRASGDAGGGGGYGLHHVAFELGSFEELRRAARFVREHHGPLR